MSNQLPIQHEDRTVIVDVLRGFALFGVLQGNLSGMITNSVPDTIIQSHANSLDRYLQFAHDLFIQNKFLTLFAILFGYGFGVIMERLQKKKIDPVPFFLRRMLWLFIFGLLNLAVWNGDILHIYAMTGVLLLLFRKLSNRSILFYSILFLFIIPVAIRFYQQFFLHYSVDGKELVNGYYQAYKYGSLKDVVIVNYQSYFPQWVYTWVEWRDMSEILGKFLLGYYILRRQILIKLNENFPLIKTTSRWSFLIMFLYMSLLVLIEINAVHVERYLLYPFFKIGILATAIFYAASIIQLHVNNKIPSLMNSFQSLGRMTLTNYLTHTIIYLFFFYNIGLGLLGNSSFTVMWLVSFIIYFLQILLSNWWLSRFSYGPIEWVWRQLTYLKRMPIRKKTVLE